MVFAPTPIPALRDYRAVPAAAVAASLAEHLLAFAVPLAVLQIYDRVIPNASLGTLQLLVLGLLGAVLIEAVFKTIRMRVIEWHAAGALYRAQLSGAERLLAQPSAAFERTPFGVQVDRFAALDTLKENLHHQPLLRWIDTAFIALALAVMAAAGGWLVAVPLLVSTGLVLAARRQRAVHGALLTERNERDRRRYSFLNDLLDGMETVKALLMEEQMQRRYERLQAAGALYTRDLLAVGGHAQSVAMLASALNLVGVVALGGWLVIHEQAALGAVAASVLLGGRAIQLIVRVFGSAAAADVVMDAERRAEEFETIAPHHPGEMLAQTAEPMGIEFRGACLDGDVPPECRGFDLLILPGESVGLRVQRSGEASLLLRSLIDEAPLEAGSILLDGIPIERIDRDCLMEQIGYVGEQVGIFRGRLLDNLTMFETGDRIDQAREAAALIGLEKLIHQLPAGYDTEIGGSGGRELPRGLVQLIGIARALAKRPRLLMLDQANASLDRDSEAALLRALEKLRGKITILIATQRPSLLRFCERIVDVEKLRSTEAVVS